MSTAAAAPSTACDCAPRRARPSELCGPHRTAWPAFRTRGLTVEQFLQAGSLPVWTGALAEAVEPLLVHARRNPALWQPAALERWLWQRVATHARRDGQLLVVAAPAELAAAFLRRPASDRTPEVRLEQRRELGRLWLPLRLSLGMPDCSVPLLAGLGYRWHGFDGPLAGLDQALRHHRPTSAADHGPDSSSAALTRVDAALAWRAHFRATSTRGLLRRLLPDGYRVPASAAPYLRCGFADDEAERWHRLIDRYADPLGLLAGEPTLRTARTWRAAGFDAAATHGWLRPWGRRSLPYPAAELGRGFARTSAAFRRAGFTDLRQAMPYLQLATRDSALTAAELFWHCQQGTPADWLEAFTGGGHASR